MTIKPRLTAIAASLMACGCTHVATDRPPARGLHQIEHIVVIYAENRSFDHLYGLFPGAEGIAQATAEQKTQLDHDGKPLPSLPPVYVDGKPSDDFPKGLANGPFRIDAPPVNRRLDELLPSPIHSFYNNREQVNGGKNNLFVAMSDRGAWTMGYFDGSSMNLWRWAREYTLADHFFQGAFGGSYLNHQWLVCACTPEHKDAPVAARPQLDEQGRLKKRPGSPASVMTGPVQVFNGRVSPDGFMINNVQPPYQPSGVAPAESGDLNLTDPAKATAPPHGNRTVGDTLSAKGVSWAWYAQGWRAALADGRRPAGEKRNVIYSSVIGSPNFQPHHHPFNYYLRFAPGTAERERHLQDYDDFITAIDAGTLPEVSFYKPAGRFNQHPGYTDVASGDAHIDQLLQRLRASSQWKNMAIIITYDENGGYWDHVPPPSGPGWGDRWGPGTRIPAIIVSPFARRGFVDRTPYDTTSIIKFITLRFGLEPLPGAREKAGDLTRAFAF